MCECKFEVGKTYKRRDGGKVRIVAKLSNGRRPFVGIVTSKGGTVELVKRFREDGSHNPSCTVVWPEYFVWTNVDGFSSQEWMD